MIAFPAIAPGLFDIDGPALHPPATQPSIGQHRAAMFAELSWVFDPLCIFAAASLASLLGVHWFGVPAAVPMAHDESAGAWFAAVLAPFMLRDWRFGALASRGRMAALAGTHVLRFAILALLVLLAGILSETLERLPLPWLLLWLLAGLASTVTVRWLVASGVARLQRAGGLCEVIALVGGGAVADRLVQELRRTRAQAVELVGIFDDRAAPGRAGGSAGSVAQLVELGKTRRIDWIILTLPPSAEQRLQALVQRLKALSAPIGLCPQHVGLAPALHTTGWIGDRVAVARLAEHPALGWQAFVATGSEMVPRWIVTLLELVGSTAIDAARWAATALRPVPALPSPRLAYTFDDYDVDSFVAVAAGFGRGRYGYAVTPNVDHLIRLHDDATFRELYAKADYVLLDSRFLSRLLRLTQGLQLPVCTGSDLTARLFGGVMSAEDPLVLIGGSDAQAQALRQRYGLRRLAHFNPPMGFIHDPAAVQDCLRFVEAHSPFRFCLLALGSPQQEVIAQALAERGRSRGLALCIGASINFLTGVERRAPLWMQHCGIEWLYRLLQAPGRMAGRYLVRGPRVFALLRQALVVLRPAVAVARSAAPSPRPLRLQVPLRIEAVAAVEPAGAE